MSFKGISTKERKRLELEVVSDEARLKLTRLLRARVNSRSAKVTLIHQNHAVNVARAVLGLSIYTLDGGGWDEYEPGEYGWHIGELELVMRRPTTSQLAETLGDLVSEGCLVAAEVNAVLEEDDLSFSVEAYEHPETDVPVVTIKVQSDKDLKPADMSEEHPNIRSMCKRMDLCIEAGDAPGALHASGSIFEALAKEVVGTSDVQSKSLGQFFNEYKDASRLPPPVLEYIQGIFRRRNKEPTAGHGGLGQPTITLDQMIVVVEMTKALVRAERALRVVQVAKGSTSAPPSSPKGEPEPPIT